MSVMNQRVSSPAVAALLGAVLLSCASTSGTRIITSWREPSAGELKFKKVLVLCFAPHDSQQLFGEVELVRLMKRTQGVAAHTVMSAEDVKDEQKMRALMAREGFDGAVTLRVVNSNQRISESGAYVPAAGGFWGYYSVWPMAYGVDYVRVDRRVQMEVQVFSMKDAKLVWSSYTETLNPDSAQEVVNGVAQAVAADLRKQRLLE